MELSSLRKMKDIKFSEREIDFLRAVVTFYENSDLRGDYAITRKGYKFTKKEMALLQEKLK